MFTGLRDHEGRFAACHEGHEENEGHLRVLRARSEAGFVVKIWSGGYHHSDPGIDCRHLRN
jgi:hypothetical protein